MGSGPPKWERLDRAQQDAARQDRADHPNSRANSPDDARISSPQGGAGRDAYGPGGYPPGAYPPGSYPARTYPTESGFQDEISLVDIFRLLYRGKWIVLASFLLISAGVFAYTHVQEPEYEASALVLLHVPEQGDRALRQALSMTAGGVLSRNDRSITNELSVLQNSTEIAEEVAEALRAQAVTPETGEPLSVLYDEDGTLLPKSAVVDRILYGAMRFAPDSREVDIIRLTANSTDPEEAALLANVYATTYTQATREAGRERAASSRDFLERQEETRRAELQRIEEEVEEYMSREGAIALDSEGRLLVQQISQLEDQRDRARIELQMQRASLASLEEELTAIQPQLAQRMASGVERDIQAAQEKTAELEVRRQQIYLRNPSLRERPGGNEMLTDINSQIASLRDSIQVLSRQYVDEVMAVSGIDLTIDGGGLAQVADLKRKVVDARITISGLEAQIEVMDRRLEEHDAKLRELPQQTIQLAQMQRARSSAERMYLNIVETLQEVRIAEESELGYASVIRQARVPGSPVRPRKAMNMMLGMVLSLMLGVGLAFVKGAVDKKIYTPDGLIDAGLAVAGVIPRVDKFVRKIFDGEDAVERDGRLISTRLITLLSHESSASEAYRQLRTNVLYGGTGDPVRTLVVTSAGAGEGKSMTAANLAVVVAQAGRRTLLIDADLRRPRAHTEFGIDRSPGLVEMLRASKAPDLEALASDVPNLYILPPGERIPNSSETVESKRMRFVLSWLKERFDVIIIDTPPVLLATEGTVLAGQCDATLVVAAAGETQLPELERCIEKISEVGGNVTGTVLNRFHPNIVDRYGSRYGYYGKYYDRDEYAYGYAGG